MKILRGEAVRLKIFLRPFVVGKYLRTHEHRMLDIGSGPFKGVDGWLTADAFKSEADIYLNAKHGFPFPDGSFDIVYSEHLIEHIYIDKVPRFLREIHRILKPGGLCRIATPDLEIYAANYVAKNDDFFATTIKNSKARWGGPAKNKFWLVRSNGGAFMTRAVQRFYHHRWMYDYETLASCLQEVGFTRCVKQSCGESLNEAAGRRDGSKRWEDTLYVDAVK